MTRLHRLKSTFQWPLLYSGTLPVAFGLKLTMTCLSLPITGELFTKLSQMGLPPKLLSLNFLI
jgi:hypothetical protein